MHKAFELIRLVDRLPLKICARGGSRKGGGGGGGGGWGDCNPPFQTRNE